jgi:hypothetical protein
VMSVICKLLLRRPKQVTVIGVYCPFRRARDANQPQPVSNTS